jgi:hypothetical protein
MMKRRLAGAVVAMLVAGLSAAGCGAGGDDKPATTTAAAAGPALTKAQYIAAADKVCQATKDKIEAAAVKLRDAAKKTGTIAVPTVTKFLTDTSLPAYDALIDDLNKLTPPKDDEKTIDGMIAAFAEAVEVTKRDPVAYSKNGASDPFDDANARAIDYGMKVCGS